MIRLAAQKTLARIRQSAVERNISKWLDRLVIPSIETKGRTIVFNTARSARSNIHLTTDFFIGYLLARNGNRAIILLDDGVLQHWDTVQHNRVADSPLNPMRDRRLRKHMKRQVENYAKSFAAPGLELHWYSDILPTQIDTTTDDEIEQYANESTMRFFQQSRFDADNHAQRDYRRLSVLNSQVSRAVARRVADDINPDVFATSHAVYSTWGPAYQYAKRAGITTRMYCVHPYCNGGMLIQDAPAGAIDHKALEAYLQSAPFDSRQRSVAKKYIADRFSHSTSDTKEYFSGIENRGEATVKSFVAQSESYEFTFGLFPNVVWDAIGEHLDTNYSDVIDWVIDTVRTISKQPKNRLIIRFHPAEATRMRGTLPSFDLIRERLPEITEYPNIFFIHPDQPVNSYDLLRSCIDVALVYTGTLGAEAQLLGIPVVPSAVGRFSSRFVQGIGDLEEYHQILRDPSQIIQKFTASQDSIIEYILKYHYYVNEELFFPNGILSMSHRTQMIDEKVLGDPTSHDQTAMAKTLQGFIA